MNIMVKGFFMRSDVDRERKIEELQIYSKLSTSKKLEHIKIYYKHRILFLAVVFIIVCGLVNAAFAKKMYAHIVVYGQYMDDNMNDVIYEYMQPFVDNTKRREIRIYNYYLWANGREYNVGAKQAFEICFASGDFDVIIAKGSYSDELLGLGVYMDLRNVLSSDELAALGGRVLMYSENGSEPVPYAVTLDYSSFVDTTGFNKSGRGSTHIGIVSNTERFERAKTIFLELLKDG